MTTQDLKKSRPQGSGPEFLCLGELLIDCVPIPSQARLSESQRLRIAPGGAPANVAVALARLGAHAGFIGKAGLDSFGRYLYNKLREEQVDLTHFTLSPKAPTRVAFVTNDPDEAQRFVFYGRPGADELLEPRDICSSYFAQARFFHFGSISLIGEPSRSATLAAISQARRHGLTLSFDPNLRPGLWPSLQRARSEIQEALRFCHLLKVNQAEWEFLFPGRRFEDSWSLLERQGIRLAVLTLAGAGALVANRQGRVKINGLPVKVKDTTGAGDGFVAGLLYAASKQGGDLRDFDRDKLQQLGSFANGVAALSCTKLGAIPAFPRRRRVMSFLRS